MLNISRKFYGEKELDEAMDVTNKYFGKKEEIVDDANEDSGAKMEIVDDDKTNHEHPSTLVDTGQDEESGQKKEDNATTVSIDVTKALLLLGINAWSNLEPGVEMLSW